MALDKMRLQINIFLKCISPQKTYDVGPHLNHLNEVIWMSTHNVCFWIRKISTFLLTGASYLKLWYQTDFSFWLVLLLSSSFVDLNKKHIISEAIPMSTYKICFLEEIRKTSTFFWLTDWFQLQTGNSVTITILHDFYQKEAVSQNLYFLLTLNSLTLYHILLTCHTLHTDYSSSVCGKKWEYVFQEILPSNLQV